MFAIKAAPLGEERRQWKGQRIIWCLDRTTHLIESEKRTRAANRAPRWLAQSHSGGISSGRHDETFDGEDLAIHRLEIDI